MQKNYRLFFIITVIAAVAAALIGAYGYNTVARMVPVVVASQDINPDEMPTSKLVTMGKEPAGALKGDTITRFEDLQEMVARGYIPAGTPLRKSMFQPAAGAGISAKLATMNNGCVAVAVGATIDSTVGNAVKRGDKVSIKATMKGGTAVLLAPNAEILDIPAREGSSAVILAVTPQEAEKIEISRANGMLVWFELLPAARD